MRPVERHLVRWSGWATGLTGVVYFWMKHFMDPSEPWAAVNHPLQPLVLKAHILVAPVLVFALGMITVGHAWRHWLCRVPAGRRSGVTVALIVGPMILTGYLIQALTHPAWLSVVAWGHIVLGLLYLVAFAGHTVSFGWRGQRGGSEAVDRGSEQSAGCHGRAATSLRRRTRHGREPGAVVSLEQ